MNFLQLVIKQMRQRALSTTLTLLSVLLGFALAIALLVFQRESGQLLGQTNFGYDMLVGIKGSPQQLVLNTVFHLSASPGNIDYSVFEDLQRRPAEVKWAVPFVLGDEFNGHRIIGTLPGMFPTDWQGKPLGNLRDPDGKELRNPQNGKPIQQYPFEYKTGQKFELAEGRSFHPAKFEGVIGAEVARRQNLKLGSTFKAQHGGSTDKSDEHDEAWTVVGILKPTHTAHDRAIYIPMVSFLAIPKHEKYFEELKLMQLQIEAAKSGRPIPKVLPPELVPADHDDHDHDAATQPGTTQAADHDEHDGHAGHHHEEAYTLNPDGTIALKLPRSQWKISGIFVQTRGFGQWGRLDFYYKNQGQAMGVSPAMVMREFLDTFLKPSTMLLLLISVMVVVVAAVSILVSIYNSISARRREIAILRALGATRVKILTLIATEAGLIGLIGGVLGLLLGHAIAGGVSVMIQAQFGEGLGWYRVTPAEAACLGGVVLLAVIAGLVPAMKAYATPVATNLVAE